MTELGGDLFKHYRDRLSTLTFDHIDTCKRARLPNEEIMSLVLAALIHEMLIMVKACGGTSETLEEDVVQMCREHFAAIEEAVP